MSSAGLNSSRAGWNNLGFDKLGTGFGVNSSKVNVLDAVPRCREFRIAGLGLVSRVVSPT